MKRLLLLLLLCFIFSKASAQTTYLHYLYTSDYTIVPTFDLVGGELIYNGNDPKYQSFFSKYTILKFERAFPTLPYASVEDVFVIESTSKTFANDMIDEYPAVFLMQEVLATIEPEMLYYPNDYGTTSPVANLGAPYSKKELDYHNAPTAWDITLGDLDIDVGISDHRVNDTLPDFSGKTTILSAAGFPNHGNSVAAFAAAKGDNASGLVGVCMDCGILSGRSGLTSVYNLAAAGAKVINMSWFDGVYYGEYSDGFRIADQDAINGIVNEFNVTLVAAAGNRSSYTSFAAFHDFNGDGLPDTPFGTLYVFPAAYDNVISVGSVHHLYPELNSDSYCCDVPYGFPGYRYIEDSVSQLVDGTDPSDPIGRLYSGYFVSPTNPIGLIVQNTTNENVDLMAAGYDLFQYGQYIYDPPETIGSGTSYSAPLVTGTVGLMYSVNECLLNSEVEDILKLSSKDIEHTNLNAIYFGHIGTGKLEIEKSVKFVEQMKSLTGNAVISDHIFYRYDFDLKHIMNDLTLQDVTFHEGANVDFMAKSAIYLEDGTILEPDSGASVVLQIDSAIELCAPGTESMPAVKSLPAKVQDQPGKQFVLFPTIVQNQATIQKLIPSGEAIARIVIFNSFGQKVFDEVFDKTYQQQFVLSQLATGIYIAKFYSESDYELHTTKFIKN